MRISGFSVSGFFGVLTIHCGICRFCPQKEAEFTIIRAQIKHTKNFSIKNLGMPPKILFVWVFSGVLKRKEAPAQT